jgi:hypothetical protein
VALDSADKRSSSEAGGLPFLLILPAPEGTIDAADRLHVSGLYRGIAAAGVVAYVPPPIGSVAVSSRPLGSVQGPSGS